LQDHAARARVLDRLGILALMIVRRNGNGIINAGLPAAANSATVVAPAR
jgi:hypothetical protein